jgi:maltose-binding protein MalE
MLMLELCVRRCFESVAAVAQIGRRGSLPLIVVLLLCLSVGCTRDVADSNKPTKSKGSPERNSAASLTLDVLVVNEPEVEEAIGRLRGEWEERSGGQLATISKSWSEVSNAEKLKADVIVFPSRYLGELSIRGMLRPVRSNVLQSKEFNEADLLPVVRSRLMKWGDNVMALPMGVELPSASSSQAVRLLAHVAPRIVSDVNEGLLFDTRTMKPRITDAPFVEAVQAAKSVRRGTLESSKVTDASRVVPVLGYGDRMIAVTSESQNAASAFKLIEWLASPETSTQIAKGSDPMTPVRRSLLNSPAWYDTSLDPEQKAALVERAKKELGESECLLVPRIPGVDDYLAALDGVVDEAVAGDVEAEVALKKAAERWEAITDARGRDAQRKAYLMNLGIDEP